ncbi:MAG: imidazole glycerol phosphate synthase subunit HisH [Ardenticatenia bacterium]|nr:imidazole glycerol phosphate synthase subunit HisH [Ardenticatenia bacterium]
MSVVIVDYGAGNLRSVQKAFEAVGAAVTVTGDPERVRQARKLVLPGVGAFGEAMARLQAKELVEPLRKAVERGTPLLGICLGLQLLFEESEELGHHRGLGIFPGRVERFRVELKVPHIGWNQVRVVRSHPLLAGFPTGQYAYFVHSYHVRPADPELILAVTEYGVEFPCICGRDHVMGIQFHPEKSQEVGLLLLRNFMSL